MKSLVTGRLRKGSPSSFSSCRLPLVLQGQVDGGLQQPEALAGAGDQQVAEQVRRRDGKGGLGLRALLPLGRRHGDALLHALAQALAGAALHHGAKALAGVLLNSDPQGGGI